MMREGYDYTPGQELIAESAVLGRCMLWPLRCLAATLGRLTADDFTNPGRQALWRALVALRDRDAPIDPESVLLEALRRAEGPAEEKAIALAVIDADLQTSSPSNVDHYAQIVIEQSRLRVFSRRAKQLAKESITSMEQAVTAGDELVRSLTMEDAIRPRLVGDVAREMFNDLEQRTSGEAPPKLLPSGLTALDRRLGGIGEIELWVVGARPGVGKSGLALAFAMNAAERNMRSLVFSLEMSDEQNTRRLIADDSGLDANKLRRAEIGDDDWEALAKTVRKFEGLPIGLVERAELKLRELVSACEVAAVRGWRGFEQRLGLIIVDYLQLIEADPSPSRRHRSREEEVKDVARGLKALAKKLKVPVIALAQVNRDQDKRNATTIDMGAGNPKIQLHVPKASELRESGAIEAFADVILLPHREHLFDPSVDPEEGWIFIGKSRESGTGKLRARFNKHSTLWEDMQ
jgi:replicative DNA helicase